MCLKALAHWSLGGKTFGFELITKCELGKKLLFLEMNRIRNDNQWKNIIRILNQRLL